MAQSLTLILGGIRSGKTSYALQYGLALRKQGGKPPAYVATARYNMEDDEMKTRIDLHREERGREWQTIEAPFNLSMALSSPFSVIVIDCLSLWVTNLMHQNRNKEGGGAFYEIFDKFLDNINKSTSHIIIVSNEVGLGGISANQTQREFSDLVGVLHQRVAFHCVHVFMVVAGLPMMLKSDGVPTFLKR